MDKFCGQQRSIKRMTRLGKRVLYLGFIFSTVSAQAAATTGLRIPRVLEAVLTSKYLGVVMKTNTYRALKDKGEGELLEAIQHSTFTPQILSASFIPIQQKFGVILTVQHVQQLLGAPTGDNLIYVGYDGSVYTGNIRTFNWALLRHIGIKSRTDKFAITGAEGELGFQDPDGIYAESVQLIKAPELEQKSPPDIVFKIPPRPCTMMERDRQYWVLQKIGLIERTWLPFHPLQIAELKELLKSLTDTPYRSKVKMEDLSDPDLTTFLENEALSAGDPLQVGDSGNPVVYVDPSEPNTIYVAALVVGGRKVGSKEFTIFSLLKSRDIPKEILHPSPAK